METLECISVVILRLAPKTNKTPTDEPVVRNLYLTGQPRLKVNLPDLLPQNGMDLLDTGGSGHNKSLIRWMGIHPPRGSNGRG